MRIGTLLLELLIVLAIIFCLYYISMNRTKSVLTNEQGQLITEDIKSIVNDANRISAGAISQKRDLETALRKGSSRDIARNEKEKKDLQKKINNMMRKYNIN